MASNYTENYQLPLWAADDAFLRTEFNDANQKIDAALGTIPKIVLGSYTGTGTYGSGSPCSLSFGRKPALVLVRDGDHILSLMNPVTDSPNTAHSNYGVNTASWSETGVSWYCLRGADYQMNTEGRSYPYLAILI